MEKIMVRRLSKSRREITIPESPDPNFADEIPQYLAAKGYRQQTNRITDSCIIVSYTRGKHSYYASGGHRYNGKITFDLVREW